MVDLVGQLSGNHAPAVVMRQGTEYIDYYFGTSIEKNKENVVNPHMAPAALRKLWTAMQASHNEWRGREAIRIRRSTTEERNDVVKTP